MCLLYSCLVDQLSREEREEAQVEHSISSLQHDVARLNSLITEKKGQQEKLEQGTILMENDFIHALKVCSYYYSCMSVTIWSVSYTHLTLPTKA